MIIDPPLTIEETQVGLIHKDFTCVDLIDSYIDRIKKFDKNINSVLTTCEDSAYEKAKNSDNLIRDYKETAFKDYPLLGITVIHKDMFLTKGIRTTAASKILKDFIPPYSATIVNRLDKAGCIILGKANCDAWAHGSSGENSDFGPTKNPWDEKYVSGGSSSGSAASIASNFSLFSTGTDTCGSIRLPANYCGVYGLKPTYGIISRYGVIAMASSLDCVGHLTRTVNDSEKVFNTLKGIDYKDATLTENNNLKTIKKLKIGIPKEYFINGIDKEMEKKILEALDIYKKNGIEITDISLPHTKYGISVYYIIQPAEVSSNLGRYDGIRYGQYRDSFASEAKRRIMLGTYVLSSGYYDAYYLKAMKVRTIIINEVEEAFNNVDVILAPVSPTPPFKLGEKIDDPLSMYMTDIYAATANLTGIPALAIPYGFSKKGLPLGFQIMAPKFCEDRLFYLAELFEKLTEYKPKVK